MHVDNRMNWKKPCRTNSS